MKKDWIKNQKNLNKSCKNEKFADNIRTITTKINNKMSKQEFYFSLRQRRHLNEGECLTSFETEDEARDFVISEMLVMVMKNFIIKLKKLITINMAKKTTGKWIPFFDGKTNN